MNLKSLIFSIILIFSTTASFADFDVKFFPNSKGGRLPLLTYTYSNFNTPQNMGGITITPTSTGFSFYNDGSATNCNSTVLSFTLTVTPPKGQSFQTPVSVYVPPPTFNTCVPVGKSRGDSDDPSWIESYPDSDQCIHANNQTYTLIYTINGDYDHLELMLYPASFGSCQ